MIRMDMDGAERKALIDRVKEADNSKAMGLAEQLSLLGSLQGVSDKDIIAYLLYALRLEQIKVQVNRKPVQVSAPVLSKYQQDMKSGKVKPALNKNLHNEDIQALKEMGLSNKEIAEIYHVSDRTIRNRLKAMETQASMETQNPHSTEWTCYF